MKITHATKRGYPHGATRTDSTLSSAWIRMVPAPELQGADVTQYGMTRWLERRGRRALLAMGVLAAIAVLLALLAPHG